MPSEAEKAASWGPSASARESPVSVTTATTGASPSRSPVTLTPETFRCCSVLRSRHPCTAPGW